MNLKYNTTESGEYICHHCQFTAKNQSTMHYHLKKHEGPLPHPCKHCSARFMQKSLLELHIRSRHSETLEKKDTFKCPCEGCHYEDIRKGNRLIHFVRVHMKDLSDTLKTKTDQEGCVTECKCCNKGFKNLTQFYYHASDCIEPTEKHTEYSNWKAIKA
jgi:hypothetical protein